MAKAIDEMSEEEVDRLLDKEIQAGNVNIDDLDEEQVDTLLAMKGVTPEAKEDEGAGFFEAAGALGKAAGNYALESAVTLGDYVDSVTGAPTRAAVSKAAEPIKPEEDYGPDILVRATKAMGEFYDKFGEDVSKSPSPSQMMKDLGVSGDRAFTDREYKGKPSKVLRSHEEAKDWANGPERLLGPFEPLVGAVLGKEGMESIRKNATYQDVYGVPAGVATDWTNAIPVAKAVKAGAAKLPGAAAKLAALLGKGSASLVDATIGGNAVRKTVDAVDGATREAIKSTVKLANPKVAKDAEEFFAIAAKHGIDQKILPESIEFGKEGLPARMERWKREGPLGEESLKNYREAAHQVDNAIDTEIDKIGGGNLLDPNAAGRRIREAFDHQVKTYFDQFEETYNNIIKGVPGLNLTEEAVGKINKELGRIERIAKRKMARGTNSTVRAQGKELMMKVDFLKDSKTSFKQMVEAIRDVGEDAFQAKRNPYAIPEDTKLTMDLYHTMKDALLDTVKVELGPEVAANLRNNNKMMSEFFDDKSLLGQVIGRKFVDDTEIFNALVKNGNATKIKALKRVLQPDDLAHVKGAVIESLVKRNIEDGISYRGLHNAMESSKSRQVLGALFEPDELKEIKDLMRLGDRLGVPVLSTSGTGASLSFANIPETLRSVITNDALIDVAKQKARSEYAFDINNVGKAQRDANIPFPARVAKKVISNSGMVNRTPLGEGLKMAQGMAVGSTAMKPKQLEGFPIETLQDLAPEEVEPLVEEVQKDPSMSSIQKAKLINLMRRHRKFPAQ